MTAHADICKLCKLPANYGPCADKRCPANEQIVIKWMTADEITESGNYIREDSEELCPVRIMPQRSRDSLGRSSYADALLCEGSFYRPDWGPGKFYGPISLQSLVKDRNAHNGLMTLLVKALKCAESAESQLADLRDKIAAAEAGMPSEPDCYTTPIEHLTLAEIAQIRGYAHDLRATAQAVRIAELDENAIYEKCARVGRIAQLEGKLVDAAIKAIPQLAAKHD